MGEGLLTTSFRVHASFIPLVRRQISRHAAQLRRDRTEAEDRVWQALRNRQIGHFKWRFQHSIARRVADFVCLEVMLIVELDGSQHDEEVDARRTAELKARGFAIIRFWNADVFQNLDGVLETILTTAQQRIEEGKRRPSPNPLPRAGEG